MIRVEKIAIHEFRGIRDLTLEIGKENFAICGPNGTGKSGIVDALEFALTGNISRLSGSGTGGLSVKDHGPHVDSRNKPAQASVELTVYIPSLNKNATILRTTKDIRNPKITPSDTSVQKIIDYALLHPEFTLSRRELIRYVLAEPGQRSKEVQALLRLDEIEVLRTTFQKIANASKKEVASLERSKINCFDQLARALNITQVTTKAILDAVNPRRTLLGLPVLSVLEASTSIKDGLATTSLSIPVSRVPKVQALADVKGVREQLALLSSQLFIKECQLAAEAVAELGEDADSLVNISREALLRSSLELFDENVCPVCETSWNPEEFRRIVSERLKHFGEVAKKRIQVENLLKPLIDQIATLASTFELIVKYGGALKPFLDVKDIEDYICLLKSSQAKLKIFIPLEDAANVLESICTYPPKVMDIIDRLEEALKKLPEPSQQDAAREYLTIGQERLDIFRHAKLELKTAEDRAQLAKKVWDLYGAVTTAALEEMYRSVEETFSKLYRFIHREDEDTFQAHLTPSIGKLGFDVDFYGRGFFPPGAYHSEGHQDCMGLCLYLALMSHLLGDRFTFSVLDDVLMSVDSGHRRDVSNLLREEFPNTQFIFTTHDEIWLRHMKSTGLVASKRFIHFRTWNVDIGPTEWSDRDVWQEIGSYIERNDVRSAAALLRHYLEHVFKEICQQLRAQVEFREDTQFTLGDLLPSAIVSLKKYLKKGKDAAQSWGQVESFDFLVKIDAILTNAIMASEVEKWQINTAVHYNEWASFQEADFKPVVKAFKVLIDQFMCEKCGSLFYVVPDRGKFEALRCGCSSFNVNLVNKP